VPGPTALINRLHTTHHAVGGLHRNAAYAAFAQVLLHLQDDVDGRRHLEAVAHDANGFVNRGQTTFGKLNVHGGTGDLNYTSDVFWHKNQPSVLDCQFSVAF